MDTCHARCLNFATITIRLLFPWLIFWWEMDSKTDPSFEIWREE